MKTGYARVSTAEQNLDLQQPAYGRAAAQKRGVKFGRKSKHNEQQRSLILEGLEAGKSVNEFATAISVSADTIYRAMKSS